MIVVLILPPLNTVDKALRIAIIYFGECFMVKYKYKLVLMC